MRQRKTNDLRHELAKNSTKNRKKSPNAGPTHTHTYTYQIIYFCSQNFVTFRRQRMAAPSASTSTSASRVNVSAFSSASAPGSTAVAAVCISFCGFLGQQLSICFASHSPSDTNSLPSSRPAKTNGPAKPLELEAQTRIAMSEIRFWHANDGGDAASHIFFGGNSIVVAIEIGSGADLSVGVVRSVRGAENEFMADIVFIFIYFPFTWRRFTFRFLRRISPGTRYIYLHIYTYIFFIIIVFVVVIVFWSIASHKNEMPATLTQPLAMACCCLAHAFLRLRCWLIFMATFFDG